MHADSSIIGVSCHKSGWERVGKEEVGIKESSRKKWKKAGGGEGGIIGKMRRIKRDLSKHMIELKMKEMLSN